MDPLVSALHTAHRCDAHEQRAREALALGLDNTLPAQHAALHATCAAALSRAAFVRADDMFMADCEDASCCLYGVAHAAAHMEPEHLGECVRAVMLSAAFSAEAAALLDSVLVVLPHIREPMRHLQVGLCFAHAKSISDVRAPASAPVLVGVRAHYDFLVNSVNAGRFMGHACVFDTHADAEAQEVHPLFSKRVVRAFDAHEGTNPVTQVRVDSRCLLNTESSLPMLNVQLATINGEMPRTAADSIVSEITAKSVANVLACSTTPVTHTTADSSFYHSMISIGKGYLYSEDVAPPAFGCAAAMLPTTNIAAMHTGATRTVALEGKLLVDVDIGAMRFDEVELLGMVVGAATCLAPGLADILEQRVSKGFQVMAGQPPLADHNTSRVVVRGRQLPFTADLSPAEHMQEVAAREAAALRVHPGARAVSLSSHAWNLYVPQSSGG